MPNPTDKQKEIIWMSLTGLALLVLFSIGIAILAGILWLAIFLKAIFLPVAAAGILAYILFPGVVWIEKTIHSQHSRTISILILFSFLALVASLTAGFVIPNLYSEVIRLGSELPQKIVLLQTEASNRLNAHPELADQIRHHLSDLSQEWPKWSAFLIGWIGSGIAGISNFFALGLGFVFMPLYTFYFLRDQASIEANWKEYIPIHRSRWRDEIVFILNEINTYLIVFFRGQVLVACCLACLTSIGLLSIGLNYALLVGLLSGLLSIIPYLGVVCGLTASCFLALAQDGGGMGLAGLVILVFAVVQFIEGFVISPKIMGEKTGLHPLTVILSILIWSQLLGGVLGALLAIPLTATIKVLMHRYVWR